ncbi:hypothetical protein SFC43_13875 [Bacteroides sp. CR5/BHMF/2]|nr:hypothetical protein [Bacteroides sp. CR5/BHMF/2]
MAPAFPIVPGNAVYPVNGYWVTAPSADASACYVWSYSRGLPPWTRTLAAVTATGACPLCATSRSWQAGRLPALDTGIREGHTPRPGQPRCLERRLPQRSLPVIVRPCRRQPRMGDVFRRKRQGRLYLGHQRAARNYIRCVQGGEEKDGASVRETIEELINYISNTNNNE